MLPKGSFFPHGYDTDFNLYLVHDALRLTLARDYTPGDRRLVVSGSKEIMDKFPRNGTITLTDPTAEDKSLSFHYLTKGDMFFEDLEILPGCRDTRKAKKETLVTQSLLAEHQGAIKSAIMAVEKYLGPINDLGQEPGEGSLVARINFLKKLIYAPRAWFVASRVVGMVPLSVEFSSHSRAAGAVTHHWDFGDGTSQMGEGAVQKTYMRAGAFDVSLTVTSEYGQDAVTFPAMIQARTQAPHEVKINIVQGPGQRVSGPNIRAGVNQLITMEVKDDGQILENNKAVDPVVAYTWNLADDLAHASQPVAKASFGEGGLYDLSVRTTTALGAYRITTFENSIDIVEKTNLWLWNYVDSQKVTSHEFGLVSETFKVKSSARLTLNTDDGFLKDQGEKRAFRQNNGCARRNKSSGQDGTCLLFWASGRGKNAAPLTEKIAMADYHAFADVYQAAGPLGKPWNWLSLVAEDKVYFLLGQTTHPTKSTLDLTSLTVSNSVLQAKNYVNGAQSLGENPHARRSACWQGKVGYVLEEPGGFYKTDGVMGEPFINLVKLPAAPQPGGKLVALSGGIYNFSNSGTVMAYRPSGSVWETSPVGSFLGTQDRAASGQGDNRLLAVSDGNHRAYLSFDYSANAFCKFNEIDLTFSKLRPRPQGEQWQMTIY